MKRSGMRRRRRRDDGHPTPHEAYALWRIDQIRARPSCELHDALGCGRSASQIHHRLLRSQGGALMDPENTLSLCMEAHAYVHANPTESYAHGWLIKRWSR
jgi:hypothetical protein